MTLLDQIHEIRDIKRTTKHIVEDIHSKSKRKRARLGKEISEFQEKYGCVVCERSTGKRNCERERGEVSKDENE